MAETQDDLAGPGTVGERLRAAREEKGLSLDDVARQTRIPIRHLEHIERSEWDAMPAVTYSVGFARSYANAVGLDGAAVGAEIRQELGLSRGVPAGPAAYYEPADPARVPPRWMAITVAVIAVLLVAGYLIWRSAAVGDGSAAEIATTEAPAPPPAGAAQAPRAAQPQAQPAAGPAASGPVVLAATEDVWLRIDEPGQAKALFQGTLKAGQRYEVPAAAQAPRLRTGRANVLQVTVAGRPVPPLGPPERTVSNVSLRGADLLGRAPGTPPQP
ncbi:MAG: helix-turn-helix domain-containing protein [Alphaproteobacteria bacterium]|nr:helix-turn-helix domain-containing protein [Alphaproteobacteria bacterium]MBV9373277.1 helix-turn-helix domain-containing protein [Alphaproteobacteria bacterium]MBV9901240.1 helix-turn-helix domain-containing protein [Alphaproteobacteria bacterium]